MVLASDRRSQYVEFVFAIFSTYENIATKDDAKV